ncbi:MAG: hypothetical protein WC888_04540 [Candidatus Izemoplasmatales bacterium]|jgi:hypothetical protein
MFNIGDLVWSEYYTRLGVVCRIITDLPKGGYTEENPGYDLGSVGDPKVRVVCGAHEEMKCATTNGYTIFKLIKIAKGYESVRQSSEVKTTPSPSNVVVG